MTPPGTYAGDLQVFDAEDPPGVRGSPGRGDPNTAHYARVEGESTKGASGQTPGDRYTEDPPGVRGSPGRGESSTAHDEVFDGSSSDKVVATTTQQGHPGRLVRQEGVNSFGLGHF